MKPTPAKPRIIIAHVEDSGADVTTMLEVTSRNIVLGSVDMKTVTLVTSTIDPPSDEMTIRPIGSVNGVKNPVPVSPSNTFIGSGKN